MSTRALKPLPKCVIDVSIVTLPRFFCRACHGSATLPLPVTMSQFVALTRDFERQHRSCRLPSPPSSGG